MKSVKTKIWNDHVGFSRLGVHRAVFNNIWDMVWSKLVSWHITDQVSREINYRVRNSNYHA